LAGGAPDPVRGVYSTPLNPLAGGGLLLREGEGTKGREARRGEIKGEGRGREGRRRLQF